MSKSLYAEDFVRWTEQQARAIRDAASAGINLPVDWENVAEEIESLGRSDRRELASRIGTIIEHLLKLEASPAGEPRRGWEETIRTQRRQLELLLEDSPSLRSNIPAVIARELTGAREDVKEALASSGEQPRIELARVQYNEAQVLGRWYPEAPPAPFNRPAGPRRPARAR